MKLFKFTILYSLFTILCAFCARAQMAQSSVTPRIYTLLSQQVLTPNQVLVTNLGTNLFNAMANTPGISVVTTITTTNNLASAGVTNLFDLTLDGTNWTTTHPLTNTLACNGTNQVISAQIYPASAFESMRAIRLTQIATGAASNAWYTVQLGVTP